MRLPSAALLVLSTAAWAAPPEVKVEEVTAAPGLVFVDLSKPGACPEDPWTPEVMASVEAHGGTARRVPWTRASADALLGDGPRAPVIRLARRDGVEVDRVCGCAEPAAVRTWVDRVAAGTTHAAATRAELEALVVPPGQPWPVEAWLQLVQDEVCADRPEAAFDVARHLWRVLPEVAPYRRDVRLTRVAHDLGKLARRSPELMAQARALRDEVGAAKDGDLAALGEWIALNRVLGDDDATLAWYEAGAADPAARAGREHQASTIVRLLVERGRWADAGRVVGDPLAWVDVWIRQSDRDAAVDGWVALAAAGRDKEGAAVAKKVLAAWPDAACPMIARATEVGVARRAQAAVARACADEATRSAWEAAR